MSKLSLAALFFSLELFKNSFSNIFYRVFSIFGLPGSLFGYTICGNLLIVFNGFQ